MPKKNYEGLDITLLSDSPISELYLKPIGKTVVLMTDPNNRIRPVLFAGPVLGGHHFLEARNRNGELEIISAVIKSKDLGIASAEDLGVVDRIFGNFGNRKEASKAAGLFDYTWGREEHIYLPRQGVEYRILLQQVNAAGLVKWAKANPYQEREPVYSGWGMGGDQEAE